MAKLTWQVAALKAGLETLCKAVAMLLSGARHEPLPNQHTRDDRHNRRDAPRSRSPSVFSDVDEDDTVSMINLFACDPG